MPCYHMLVVKRLSLIWQHVNELMDTLLDFGSTAGTVEEALVNRYGHERVPVAIAILVAAIMVVAAIVRLSHLAFIQIDLPLIDEAAGGLFLAFASEIADNGYRLPVSIPNYTDGGIPFAYPPLSFYFEAVLVYGLDIPDYIVVNALPPLIASLSVPFFYLLTGVLRLRLEVRLLALFAFAISGAAFEAQIAAAGLAEAMGTLTIIWLTIGLAKVRENPCVGWWHILTGVALGMCVIASPGSAYGSAVLCTLFAVWQMVSRRSARWQTLLAMIVIAVTGLFVSAPYVVIVFVNHGLVVFLEPLVDQHGSPVSHIFDLVSGLLQFTVLWNPREGFFLNAVVAFGLIHEVVRRRWWMAVWLAISLAIPREGDWLVAIPGCILAAVGIRWLLSIWCGRLIGGRLWRSEAFGVAAAALVIFVLFGLAASALFTFREAGRARAPAGFVEVLTLSSTSLPKDAKLITLVGVEDWSPFLIKRDVLNMRFGSEWQPNESATIASFTDDLERCPDFGCIYSLAQQKFVYRDLYFIATDKQLSGLCNASVSGSECGDVEVIESGGGVVVGKFDNSRTYRTRQ